MFADRIFLHGFSTRYRVPKTRTSCWKMKVKVNWERDAHVTQLCKKKGVRVILIRVNDASVAFGWRLHKLLAERSCSKGPGGGSGIRELPDALCCSLGILHLVRVAAGTSNGTHAISLLM